MTAAHAHDHAATGTGSDPVALAQAATAAAEALLADAIVEIRARVTVEGRPVNSMLDREQRAAHGLAWLATYVQVVRQLAAYAARARDA
ncbi:MAG TPA: acyl-CoA dehydrogenase, partial [Xanthobacteraceae bacterium]|nr:acyl-CoA dehydrogenase [Xanthobacteraceae bacterium]